MILTVASFKGGVGKTTTAIHLAAILHQDKPTLLIDGDPNRSVTGWSKRGSLPYQVVDSHSAARVAGDYREGHLVFDTKARPEREDLEALAEGCDLLVIPTTPDTMALEALDLMLEMLSNKGIKHYRVLLTKVPPKPRKVGLLAREALAEAEIPLFDTQIRLYAAPFEKASYKGILVSEVKEANAKEGWSDYLAVGREIFR